MLYDLFDLHECLAAVWSHTFVRAANHQPSNGKGGGASGTEPIGRAVGATWDEQGGAEWKEAEPPRPSATPLSHQDPPYSLAETERLFDQLTREKQQVSLGPVLFRH